MADLASPSRGLPSPLQISSGWAERPSPLPLLAVTALAVAYGLLFGWLSVERFEAFQMHALDMGNMGQAAWNTIHGHPFQFTNMRLPYNIEAWNTTTRLSFHVEALFPVISLVYLVYPHPESLLILQTVALAAGAYPVFFLARDVTRQAWLAVVFVLVYLLFPTLQAVNLYEFHPVSLAIPLLLGAFLFAWRRQYVPFLVCCLAAMGTKEEIGLVVALLGLWVIWRHRDARVGLLTAAIGAFWSLFTVLVIEKHFRRPGSVGYTHTRYGYLGHGIRGAISTGLFHPGRILAAVLLGPKLGYLVHLLAPVGFLAVLAPLTLTVGIPTFLLNVLSTDVHMYSALGDNSAELVAVILAATIIAGRRVMALLGPLLSPRLVSGILAAYLVVMSIWYQHTNGFTPFGSAFSLPRVGPHQQVQAHFVSLIPAGVPVSTQDELDPALSSRRYLYLFPDTGRPPNPPSVPADDILLDVSGPTYPLPSYQLYDAARSWILRPGWGIAAAQDGLILIRKGASSQTIPASFYTYAYAHGAPPQVLHASQSGLDVIGYSRDNVDLPNHITPNLTFTFYLRPTHRLPRDLAPVVYELAGNSLVGCTWDALGLAWFPPARWTLGHTYLVRLAPLETQWNRTGRLRLVMGLMAQRDWARAPDCASIWKAHGRTWPVGTLDVAL